MSSYFVCFECGWQQIVLFIYLFQIVQAECPYESNCEINGWDGPQTSHIGQQFIPTSNYKPGKFNVVFEIEM